MKVSLVDPSLFTLPYDRALADGLQQLGHVVTLHGRSLGDDDPAPGDVRLSADFYRLAHSRLGNKLPRSLRLGLKGADHAWSMRRLVRRLRRDKPDVIHMQWLPLPLVDSVMLKQLREIAPLVLTMHDTNPFNGDPTSGWQRHAMAGCLSQFGRVIVHTAQGASRLREQGVETDRLVQLPHGLLTAPALDLPPDPMAEQLTFLLFGKIKPYKGADILIEAFAALPEDLRAQARVRIVGKPYMDLAPLHALVERTGVRQQVVIDSRFVADADIEALLGPGTVAVFPYREIEASGVFFLALSQGRPVIASNLGSFAETMIDGKEGHLTQPGDVASLTTALAHMIGDRAFAAACSRASYAASKAVPDWTEIASKTVEIYLAAGQMTPGAGSNLTRNRSSGVASRMDEPGRAVL